MLFFCQVEALETIIYITEVAKKFGDAWVANDLHVANDTSNPGLSRCAFKMATGSGKTVALAGMLTLRSAASDCSSGRSSAATRCRIS